MSSFKKVSPSASLKKNNHSNLLDSDLALPHTSCHKRSSTHRHLQRSERTETPFNTEKMSVNNPTDKESFPLYRIGQVVIYHDKFLCIKMIFTSTEGVWTYAVETEDGDRCVIEEGLIEEPIQLGKDFPHKKNVIHVRPPVNEIVVKTHPQQMKGKKKRVNKRRIPHSKRKKSRPLHKDPANDAFQSDDISNFKYCDFTDTTSIAEELTFDSDTFFDDANDVTHSDELELTSHIGR